jgi:hypothetical protein
MGTNENTNETTAPSEKNSKSSFRDWFVVLSGLMLVLLTAALFGIGRAYRTALFYQYGLDASQAPEDFHGYLYWGYVGGMPLAIWWLASGAGALVLLGILSWGSRKLAHQWEWMRKIRHGWDELPNSKPKSYEKWFFMAYLSLVLAYLVFITFAATAKAYDAGVKKGQREIEALRQGKPSDDQWIELHFGPNDERIEVGYRLLCTDKLCSIYDPAPDKKTVRVIPLDGLKEMRVFARGPTK